jgi:hypothetical protein
MLRRGQHATIKGSLKPMPQTSANQIRRSLRLESSSERDHSIAGAFFLRGL